MSAPETVTLDITHRQEGSQATLTLAGSFTFAAHLAFRTEVLERIARLPPGHALVFELAGLGFVDSAALGMLLLARDAGKARGVRVVLRGAAGQVQRMLAVSKFNSLFAVEA